MSRFTVSCPDGRVIEGRVVEGRIGGAPEGRTLLFHDGTPSAAVDFPQLDEAAEALNLRLLSWSRPGYAGSSPRPGRTVADVVADGELVFADLGIRDYVVLGWSGGGPHALAHAALDAERCRAAATLGGPAPYGGDRTSWLDGMAPENIEEFDAAFAGEQRLTEFLDLASQGLGSVSAEGVIAGLGELVSETDQRAIDVQFAEHLATSLRSALSTGVAGWRDDDLAFVRPWGFSPGDITVPTAVWQGDEDRMVPASHGRMLAQQVPGAVGHLEADDGHLSFITRLEEILEDLVRHAGW